jgi:hypothetical protein
LLPKKGGDVPNSAAMITLFALVAVAQQPQTKHATSQNPPAATQSSSASALKTNDDAKQATLALKKLQAKTEIGISQEDYSRALGDTYFSVKLFLDSDVASSAPEFSQALQGAIGWYKAAGRLWDIKTTVESAHLPGLSLTWADCSDNPSDDQDLCKEYPGLVTDHSGKRGINYDNALPEAWRLASVQIRNADKYLK